MYRIDHDKLHNVYHSKNRASRNKMKLLLLMDGTKIHYRLTKNFSNLMQKLDRSAPKVQTAGFAEIVFNQLSVKTYQKITNLWKFKCLVNLRQYPSVVIKLNGALLLFMPTWNQSMFPVHVIALSLLILLRLKDNTQPILEQLFRPTKARFGEKRFLQRTRFIDRLMEGLRMVALGVLAKAPSPEDFKSRTRTFDGQPKLGLLSLSQACRHRSQCYSLFPSYWSNFWRCARRMQHESTLSHILAVFFQ